MFAQLVHPKPMVFWQKNHTENSLKNCEKKSLWVTKNSWKPGSHYSVPPFKTSVFWHVVWIVRCCFWGGSGPHLRYHLRAQRVVNFRFLEFLHGSMRKRRCRCGQKFSWCEAWQIWAPTQSQLGPSWRHLGHLGANIGSKSLPNGAPRMYICVSFFCACVLVSRMISLFKSCTFVRTILVCASPWA